MAEVDPPHHVVIDGRRWRATDPSIPEALRSELVHELMAARRSVGAATRAGDADAERTARARVQDAKVALGERGEPWWEPPTEAAQRNRIEATMRSLLRHRDGRTICPSDVARSIGGDGWRDLMPVVRDVAIELTERGDAAIHQHGDPVPDPRRARGPIRIAPVTPRQ